LINKDTELKVLATNTNQMLAIALAVFAVALMLIGGIFVARIVEQAGSGRTLSRALGARAGSSANTKTDGVRGARATAGDSTLRGGHPGQTSQISHAGQAGQVAAPGQGARPGQIGAREKIGGRGRLSLVLDRVAALGQHWFDTRAGRQMVAAEDRLLIDQCGFVDARARGLFLSTRLLCGIGAPLAASVVFSNESAGGAMRFWILLFFALGLGYMLPKWVLGRIAANRRQAVTDELPMFIDLLRLLQGVGLSIDQSVQVIVVEFRRVLPVLGEELDIANRQFVTGRTREQSLQRLASTYDNDDLRAVVRLIVQVDKHGGAVQEPLKQFGDRLREGRRTAMRERIGKLSVKMTTVMITTLLPALLIVTAGPGFLAVVRSLVSLAGKRS
jgi:tight adherence protein C